MIQLRKEKFHVLREIWDTPGSSMPEIDKQENLNKLL
jgi:hypothetical protein